RRDPLERIRWQLLRGRQNGQSNRQVEAGTLLPQRRRREVDGYAPHRELELGGPDAAANTFLRLLARTVGEADDREGRLGTLEACLDLDAPRVEADERMGDGAGEHATNARPVGVTC